MLPVFDCMFIVSSGLSQEVPWRAAAKDSGSFYECARTRSQGPSGWYWKYQSLFQGRLEVPVSHQRRPCSVVQANLSVGVGHHPISYGSELNREDP